MKVYLITQEGLRGERIFPLENRVTIGRTKESDIHLAEPSVSRQHAVVYLTEGEPIVEDLDSSNGTFVNEEKVKKAALKSGDALRVGKVTLRFFQEEIVKKQIDLKDTQLLELKDITSTPDEEALPLRSRRVVDTISKIPVFSSLSKEGLEQLCKGAKLVVFDKGKTIIRHGDWANCLFVILDGKVRIFTYDHQGKDVTLRFLSENHFFGESSFITGRLSTAMVQAVEETLLCKLDFEAIRGIIQEFPLVKSIMEQYHQERDKEAQDIKKAAGFDQRGHPRYESRLAVNFSISPSSKVSARFQGKTFRTVSSHISNTGVRLKVKDRILQDLPVGCDLHLEITLPKLSERIRCIGTLRHIIEGEEVKGIVSLGIEFSEILAQDRKKLEHFLYTSPTSKIKKSEIL
jgi:CRP-like cAMP-binding protein